MSTIVKLMQAEMVPSSPLRFLIFFAMLLIMWRFFPFVPLLLCVREKG